MAMLFAATYPERTRALALYGGYAHFHKWVMPPERLEAFIETAGTAWGTGATLPNFAPGRVDDAHFAQWWARFERLSASPTAAAALARMNAEIDVRDVLAAISAPTLLIHRRNDARVDPDASRYLAKKIPNAKLVEVPGRDHPIWTGDVDRVADLIEEFLTGERAVAEADARAGRAFGDRIYDTARMGDRMWSERSQRFQETWRQLVGRHGGRCVDTHGEMMISRFDGPARAIRCAAALREAAQEIGVASAQGAHVGEIELRGPPAGLTARVTMQLAAHAGRGDILASRLVADLAAGSGLHFADAGRISWTNWTSRWRLSGDVRTASGTDCRRQDQNDRTGRADGARKRGGEPDRRRQEQCRDCRRAQAERTHGQAPRRQHTAQARSAIASGGGGIFRQAHWPGRAMRAMALSGEAAMPP